MRGNGLTMKAAMDTADRTRRLEERVRCLEREIEIMRHSETITDSDYKQGSFAGGDDDGIHLRVYRDYASARQAFKDFVIKSGTPDARVFKYRLTIETGFIRYEFVSVESLKDCLGIKICSLYIDDRVYGIEHWKAIKRIIAMIEA